MRTLISLCVVLVVLHSASAALVAVWDVTTANPTTATTFAATSTQGCTASALGFSGVTAVNSAGWTFSNWPTTTSPDGTKYISWNILATPGQPLSFKTVNVFLNIAASGPTSWQINATTDPTFNTVAGSLSITAAAGTSNGYNADFTNNKLDQTEVTVYFRAYGFNAGSATAAGGLVHGGNGKDAGLVIEAGTNVRVCSCGSTACTGNTQIFSQGDCSTLKDWCNSNINNGNLVVSNAGSTWSMTTYTNSTCNVQVGTASAACGVCNSLGMLVSCDNSCSAGSPASTLSSFIDYLY